MDESDVLIHSVGEIYRLHLPGGFKLVMANSHRLIDELCDEKRFAKIPEGALAVRASLLRLVLCWPPLIGSIGDQKWSA